MASPYRDSPAPYWFARSGPPEELDLAIVGAGLVGVSTAYWSIRRGEPRAVILEASGVAAGATGRSAGLLLTGGLEPFSELVRRVGSGRAERLWELSRENGELLCEEVLADGVISCGYQAEGSWRAARAGSAAEGEWEESAGILSRRGFEVSWRRAQEVRERTGGRGLGGAFFSPGDGAVDPLALCRGLAERCGAEVRVGIRVRHLEPEGDRVLLAWQGGKVLARRVVLAVDGAIGPLVSSLATKVQAEALQAFATAPGQRRLEGAWVVAPDGLWLRQLGDGTLLAAGGAGASSPAERGFLEIPTASGQSQLEETVRELFPLAGGRPAHYRWAGTVARTGDGLPWVRTIPELPQVAYASGLDGQGLSLGFALGRRLARWLSGDEEALRLFRPEVGEAHPTGSL